MSDARERDKARIAENIPRPWNHPPRPLGGIAPGDIARIDFPGHPLHGARVQIERIDPAFNLAPEDAEPWLAEVVFYRHPSVAWAIGIGRERLAGTPENARLRQMERADDGAQGELTL